MLFNIIFVIGVLAIIATIVYWWHEDGFVSSLFPGFAALFISSIVVFASGGIIYSASMNTPNGSYVKNLNISAMSNASGAEGHTRGGMYGYYGYVGNERYIYFVKHNKDGSYELRQVNAKQARIYETATTETARAEVTKFTADHPLLFPGTNTSFQSEYKFYVPKGTISYQNDFKVDNSK
jgi:hypothetical protein